MPQLLHQILGSNDKELRYNTALLFIRNGKAVPDSLLQSIAAVDDYRYDLYVDLNRLNKIALFPAAYNNHEQLAKSKIISRVEYEKPDTITFLQKLPVQWQNKEGYIYFFKYKAKKDDTQWKLATAGLMQRDATKFEFENEGMMGVYNSDLDFTELSEIKIDEALSLDEQLNKLKKQLLYSKRKSAKQFYKQDDDMDLSASLKEMSK